MLMNFIMKIFFFVYIKRLKCFVFIFFSMFWVIMIFIEEVYILIIGIIREKSSKYIDVGLCL